MMRCKGNRGLRLICFPFRNSIRMKPSKNKSGDSGIAAYEPGVDWIDVAWGHESYRYHPSRIGPKHLAVLKKLADTGDNLNTYINQHPVVRDRAKSCRSSRGSQALESFFNGQVLTRRSDDTPVVRRRSTTGVSLLQY